MTSRTFAFVLAAGAVAVLALAAPACSSSSNDSAFGGGSVVYATPATDAGEASLGASVDAAGTLFVVGEAAAAMPTQGSPLCNASIASGVCYPDQPTTARACGMSPDGGAYDLDADYDGGLLACHVVSDGGVPVRPTVACMPSGTGGDGTSCQSSASCASTYECVGTATCRRYCCAAPCGPQEFCDTQPLLQNPALLVPVCMPLRPCDLLAAPDAGGACPTSQTCSPFVAEGGIGETTCVDVGPARQGDSCDSLHCASGLVCLGMWNEKKCYALCHTDGGTECGPTETCAGGLPLFPLPGVGVCQAVTLPDF